MNDFLNKNKTGPPDIDTLSAVDIYRLAHCQEIEAYEQKYP